MYGPDQLAANPTRPTEVPAAHESAVQGEISKADLIAALAQAPAETTPFDEYCMGLMGQVAAFFGEAASDPAFCGLTIEEKRDIDGKPLYMRIIPCDMVDGEPARRVGR